MFFNTKFEISSLKQIMSFDLSYLPSAWAATLVSRPGKERDLSLVTCLRLDLECVVLDDLDLRVEDVWDWSDDGVVVAVEDLRHQQRVHAACITEAAVAV